MPIRVACPECSAALAVPESAAGTVVKCPKCRAAMEVPEPPARRPARDDREEDDRPRRPRRRAKAGGFPAWAVVLLVLAGVGVAGVYVAVRGKGGANADPAAGGGLFGGGGSGVKYVPHESEKRYMELTERKGNEPITEAEVLATMGEPTHRGPVTRGRKNGVAFTLQEWEWKVPGSGIESSMGIVNGFASGQVIGLRTGPGKPGGDD